MEHSSLEKLTCPKWLCAILHLERERFYHSVDITYKDESSTRAVD